MTALKGTQKILASDILAMPINLGSSEMVTINQLVDIAEDIAGIKLNRSVQSEARRRERKPRNYNTLIQTFSGRSSSVSTQDWLGKTCNYKMTETKAIRNTTPGAAGSNALADRLEPVPLTDDAVFQAMSASSSTASISFLTMRPTGMLVQVGDDGGDRRGVDVGQDEWLFTLKFSRFSLQAFQFSEQRRSRFFHPNSSGWCRTFLFSTGSAISAPGFRRLGSRRCQCPWSRRHCRPGRSTFAAPRPLASRLCRSLAYQSPSGFSALSPSKRCVRCGFWSSSVLS